MKVVETTAPPRSNGVTMFFCGQILCSQPPIQADQIFVYNVVGLISEYQKGTS